ncbi:MAG: hypothetical protein G01um10147_341 [Microgenomates group bacterium Gr01-1014_7]|nr:MAG: hypothetical protein G01um10147_341 [Microgenomates group bacterium Gr01-1014_7]
MKKAEIIITTITILLVLIVGVSIIYFGVRKPSLEPKPGPIQVFTPSPKPSIIIPQGLEGEKLNQEEYGQTREEFIKSKPWVLKLPIKAGNYFISYNPETDTLIVELYYLTSSSIPKEQQLTQAKEESLNAMKSAGIDSNTQKIEYLELAKQ